jgi:histidinol-phosphate aminotransferase
MVELGTDVKPVIAAMRAGGVHVGRLFPALPTHLRVTVGTEREMDAFLDALAVALPTAA